MRDTRNHLVVILATGARRRAASPQAMADTPRSVRCMRRLGLERADLHLANLNLPLCPIARSAASLFICRAPAPIGALQGEKRHRTFSMPQKGCTPGNQNAPAKAP